MSRGRRISRVKLVPPSTEVAEKYLLEWDQNTLYHQPEDFPNLTIENLFPHSEIPGSGLTLDIGTGTGEFLNATAKINPKGCFLGVEISRRGVYHAVNQAARQKLENIVYIRSDFNLLYPLFAPNSLEMVYLNFPDPNYGGAKRRKNRILSSRFLNLMASTLTETGKLQVVTDQLSFFEDMLEIAEADDRFQKTHNERYRTDFHPPAKTRFQRAWEKYQRPVFRFELGRV
jgi:tRNA (guanine-N7-)-methyltransferase